MIWISKHPYKIDFAGNEPFFEFYSNHEQVWCRFMIARTADDRGFYTGTGATNEVVFTEPFILDNRNKRARIDVRILQSYFSAMDIPNPNEVLGAYRLDYEKIDYYIEYAEFQDGAVVGGHYTSRRFTLVNGTIAPHCFIENIPDWCVENWQGTLSSYGGIVMFGHNSEERFRMSADSHLHTHIANFNNFLKSIDIKFNLNMTESMASIAEVLSLQPDTINRVPIDLVALQNYDVNATDVTSYSVEIRDANAVTLYRCYVELIEKPHDAHQFLIQGRYGMAIPFECDSVSKQKATEGTLTKVGKFNSIDIDKDSTTFTLHTGYKTKQEMQQLADSLVRTDNLWVNGDTAYRVNFLPTTLTIYDEEEDLQYGDVEFSIGAPIILHQQENNSNAQINDYYLVLDGDRFIDDLR